MANVRALFFTTLIYIYVWALISLSGCIVDRNIVGVDGDVGVYEPIKER